MYADCGAIVFGFNAPDRFHENVRSTDVGGNRVNGYVVRAHVVGKVVVGTVYQPSSFPQ